MSPYIAYYENQAGGGSVERYNNFGRVYVGATNQRGHGIGAFLGGLFRRILPYLGSAARAVGKEALNAGMNVVGDVVTSGQPLKMALENRLTESGLNLKRRAQDKIGALMRGSGYKRKLKRIGGHKLTGRESRKTSKTAKNKKKKKCPGKKKVKKVPKKKATGKTRDLYDIFR